jgi:hypothetical protein
LLKYKVQTEGLSDHYKSGSSFYKAFNCLKALAFVKPEDVFAAFEYIKSIAPQSFKPILRYFEKNYIGKKHPTLANQRAIPLFPIQLWSVYERVLQDKPRTNNSLESWHAAFSVIYAV